MIMNKKTMKWLGALALMVMCMFTFSACGGDDDNGGGSSTSALVGTWRMDFGTSSYSLLIVNQNGTGQYKEFDKGSWEHDFSFTYTYNDGVIYANGNGKTLKIEVLSVSNTMLVLNDFPDKGANTFIKQ